MARFYYQTFYGVRDVLGPLRLVRGTGRQPGVRGGGPPGHRAAPALPARGATVRVALGRLTGCRGGVAVPATPPGWLAGATLCGSTPPVVPAGARPAGHVVRLPRH